MFGWDQAILHIDEAVILQPTSQFVGKVGFSTHKSKNGLDGPDKIMHDGTAAVWKVVGGFNELGPATGFD